MNIAIVDDDNRDLKRIAGFIKEYAAFNKLPVELSEFNNAEDFLGSFRPYAYTAIFLDIYMGGMTGIDAAKAVQAHDESALIVFLTSSMEFMGEAFSMHVFDYLEKPAKKERVIRLMDDILMRTSKGEDGPALDFTFNKQDLRLPYSDICAIRAAGHKTTITDSSSNSYEPRISYSSVLSSVSKDPRFIELLRGVTANMDYILSLSDDSCVMKNGMTLPINVKKAKSLDNIWQNYKLDCIRRSRKERRNRNDAK